MADFKIVYEEPEGRLAIPVTGAFGGPTPDGNSVVTHVYVEHATLPSITSAPMDASGTVDLSKGKDVKRADLTRIVQATLVMSPEVAHSMGRWLQDKAKVATQAREAQQKKGGK